MTEALDQTFLRGQLEHRGALSAVEGYRVRRMWVAAPSCNDFYGTILTTPLSPSRARSTRCPVPPSTSLFARYINQDECKTRSLQGHFVEPLACATTYRH